MGITLNHQNEFWLWTWVISKPEMVYTGVHYLGDFIRDGKSKHYWLQDLMLKWEHNIHTLIKTRGDIPRKVTLRWSVQSTWSGYFCRAWQKNGIRIHRSGEASLGNIFSLPLLWKIEISPTHCGKFNYNDGREIRPRPTKPGDVSRWKITKFITWEHRVD